jgi:phosphoglycolate phosphatase
MHYQTVLFDLDGTLTDPREGITRSIQFALGKLGIASRSPDSTRTVCSTASRRYWRP